MTKSAICLVFHNSEIRVPIPPDNSNELMESDVEGNAVPEQDDSVFNFLTEYQPELFSQGELNDLICDLGITKDKAKLLESRLKDKKLLSPGVTFLWYRHRQKDIPMFYTENKSV